MKFSNIVVWSGIVCLGLFSLLIGEGCGSIANTVESSSQTDGGSHVEVSKDTGGESSVRLEAATEAIKSEPAPEALDNDAGSREAVSDSLIPESPGEQPHEQASEQPLPDTGSGTIKIYLKGDLTPQTFIDKLSSQTPTSYQIALSRYFIMHNAQDPNPQLCFDLKTAAIADMTKDNLMGSCQTQTLKSGIYTYGKVKVEWVVYTVEGVLHYGAALPGKFTFMRAYSDTMYDGKSYKSGQGFIKFVGVTTTEIPYTFPQPTPVPGLTFTLVNGEFFMTFPYTKPLPIDQTNQQEHWARLHWKIHQSFRWEDKTLPNYKVGIWDVAATPSAIEVVKMFGVSGYHITSSVF